jgi:hypothetical protein
MLNDLGPILLLLIPIVAIIGGITSGIVRTLSRQRMIELAQRERIAAIERGIDPAKLPPLPSFEPEEAFGTFEQRSRRRSQGLMIAGIILIALSSAVTTIGLVMEPHENHWVVGVAPGSVGMALLLCAWLVRPKNGAS